MEAFRCDECGQFFEGVSSNERKDRAGKWEVTHTIREAPKPLAEVPHDDDEYEDTDDQVHSSGSSFTISMSSFFFGDQRRIPDFCPRCIDAIVASAHVFSAQEA